jgi:hypothetical protein
MFTTQQPSIEFQVVDESNHPIEGVEIHFVRYSLHPFPGQAPWWRTVLHTDSTGRASVEQRSEWYVAIFAPDAGTREYDWAWCIRKGDYPPVSVVGARKSLSSAEVRVVLKGKTEMTGCAWSPGYRGGKFVTNAL